MGKDITSDTFHNRDSRWRLVWAFALLFQLAFAQAEPLKLQSIDFTTLPGDRLQVQLALSGPAFSPRVFSTDNPARIALDLPGVSNALDKKQIQVGVGDVESINAIAAADRTRVVINLTELTPYNTRVEGNNVYVTLRKERIAASGEYPQGLEPVRAAAKTEPVRAPAGQGISNIDFRRGANGAGRILITLTNPKTVPDIREEGRKVLAVFPNTALPSTLARRLDVMDFATPVQTIDSMEEGAAAKLVITPATPDYEYSSYQSENQLTIEFRPLTRAEKEEIKKKNFAYSGEKLSLNFQDIPVRSVLQILGDFTHLNIVASDTVQGNVTLRLNDVPWDQALELVLKSKNLGKRQEGNIIQVMPLDELNKQIKEELESQKTVEELEPLKTEIIQVNYTNAEELKKVLLSTAEKTSEAVSQPGYLGGGTAASATTSLSASQSILSARGSVTVDPRTNQLIVKDTPRSLERVRDLVRKLDVAVRQVLIESRIVIANNDWSRELGSRFAVNRNLSAASRGIGAGTAGSDPYAAIPPPTTVTPSVPDNGFFSSGNALSNLPINPSIAGPGGALGVTVLKVGDYLLDLELSAAQRENRGEILSNPRVITSDHTKAVIKQGTQIPYTTGATATTVANIMFKDALLELDVTPHITPDDYIQMELAIKKDTPGDAQANGNVAINKKEVDTTVQVANGDTVVLGGVYEGTRTNNTDKVPFFGDLPGVGFLFRHNSLQDLKTELLVFITPKIVKQNLGQR